MKAVWSIGLCMFLLTACLREHDNMEDCRADLFFKMQAVPYVFEGREFAGYRSYYFFVEQLDLFLFDETAITSSYRYDYAYCRQHPVIPVASETPPRWYLFVANLYDPKELNWTFREGELQAWFSIVDHEEPPVLLAATSRVEASKDSVSVGLQMMVSRLEIQLTNPPAWVTGIEVTVRDIAATVSTDFILGGTTHITKQIGFDNQGIGDYWFGVNTFPTYRDKTAYLSIGMQGGNEVTPIEIEDQRLHLIPGVITRLSIEFETDEKMIISIEIDGKCEIIDGGNIII